jgi:small-conductance mechanosensitive channel
MRETIFSMIRFSGAVTMFGLEQVQNAMFAPTDTKAALVRLRDTLDSMSDSLASKLDDSKKDALDSMSKAQIEILDGAASAVNLDAVNMDTATELLKRTSDSLAGVMNGSAKPAGAA